MKKILSYISVCMMLLLGASCSDNDNWRVLDPIQPEKAEFEQLFVVGNHQGWKPEANVIQKLYPTGEDGEYAGYAQLNGEFKCTTEPNWDGVNFGKGEGENKLSKSSEADNLTAEEGYYHLVFNTKSLVYKIQKVDWGVIGNATPGGWNDDTMLNFDKKDLKLKATLKLVKGEFKFRGNQEWDNGFDYGLGENPGELAPKGGNIPNTFEGEYTIVLDLTNPVAKYEILDSSGEGVNPGEPDEPEVPSYEYFNVVGSYQTDGGWKPEADRKFRLYPTDKAGEYQGYAYVSGEFKFTSQDNRDGVNFGKAEEEGKISNAADAKNLKAEEGFYKVNINIKDMTYTLTPQV